MKNNSKYDRIQIGDAIFDPADRNIVYDGKTIDIEPKVAELLALFCRADGTLSRDFLLESLWGECGSDEALTQTVSKLRRALGDSGRPFRIVKTVPRVGYILGVNTTTISANAFDQLQQEKNSQADFLRTIVHKNSELLKGMAIGTALTLLVMSGHISMNNEEIIETEIECPAAWTPEDCIALLAAAKN